MKTHNVFAWVGIALVTIVCAVALGGNWFFVTPILVWLAGVRVLEYHETELLITDDDLEAWLRG